MTEVLCNVFDRLGLLFFGTGVNLASILGGIRFSTAISSTALPASVIPSLSPDETETVTSSTPVTMDGRTWLPPQGTLHLSRIATSRRGNMPRPAQVESLMRLNRPSLPTLPSDTHGPSPATLPFVLDSRNVNQRANSSISANPVELEFRENVAAQRSALTEMESSLSNLNSELGRVQMVQLPISSSSSDRPYLSPELNDTQSLIDQRRVLDDLTRRRVVLEDRLNHLEFRMEDVIADSSNPSLGLSALPAPGQNSISFSVPALLQSSESSRVTTRITSSFQDYPGVASQSALPTESPFRIQDSMVISDPFMAPGTVIPPNFQIYPQQGFGIIALGSSPIPTMSRSSGNSIS